VKKMENPTLTGSASGAGSGFLAQSIPQLSPIFSFKVKGGGDIYVYIADTPVARIAVITYDDTIREVAYAVETIRGSPQIEAKSLVSKAVKEWGERPNPFMQLIRNKKEMKRLANCFYARIMLW
jgi:hypothetical protein